MASFDIGLSPEEEEQRQIVPFSLFNPYTETLKLDSRLFQFGDKSIRIQQKWQPGGRGGTGIGFGASVYDCSIVLSYFLCDISDQINGASMIELGCGMLPFSFRSNGFLSFVTHAYCTYVVM